MGTRQFADQSGTTWSSCNATRKPTRSCWLSNAATGKTVWKTDRDEIPSWGTPTIVTTETGPVLVTNASNFIRGYDPRTGKELWRLGGSSKITAPTPIFGEGLFVVASGRGPERPILWYKSSAHGDLTLPTGKTASEAIVWSKTGRGSYMPTPLDLQRHSFTCSRTTEPLMPTI